MFKRKRKSQKEIQGSHQEINRLLVENSKLEDKNSQLSVEVARLKWEEGDRAILVDTNAILYYQDALLELKGNIAFSWVVVNELLNFWDEALYVRTMVNDAIDNDIGGLGWIKNLSSEERKNSKIDIACSIIRAVKNERIEKINFLVRRLRSKLERQGYPNSELDRELYRQIRLAFKRHKQILRIWPLFCEKFYTAEWRTVSSSAGVYHDVFNSKGRFQVQNGTRRENNNTDSDIVEVVEMEVGEAVGSYDTRIIADAIILQERFKEVVIITHDRRLCEAAKANNIEVAFDVSDVEMLTR